VARFFIFSQKPNAQLPKYTELNRYEIEGDEEGRIAEIAAEELQKRGQTVVHVQKDGGQVRQHRGRR